jgi:hypothetical protein
MSFDIEGSERLVLDKIGTEQLGGTPWWLVLLLAVVFAGIVCAAIMQVVL